jgi:putative MFS transporter
LNAFVIAFVLARGGVFGVFLFIAAAYGVVMLVIGLFGPRTRGLPLERVSR